ncbi:family 16 glycosylhydrolase [Roseiconus lacunae]|uniref:family 16 glycosylhydrolase n=2 Tax=Roseiconus lacunae TaxID=2605694 RepID=UPI001F337030|nr:family 16 glycosylhydrolase [Roseiconus lacunae]
MRQLMILFLAMVMQFNIGMLNLVAQTSKNNVPLSSTRADHWKIRWDRSDDFNGNEVDWKKWNESPENFGAWVWDNENNVSISGGVLKLMMRRLSSPVAEGNRTPTPYTSGMLKSHATGTYGYYEARMKGALLFPGVCPSFWLYSKIDDSIIAKDETRYSEVDIVELTQRGDRVAGNERIADCNLHAILSNGSPGIQGREWHRPNDERYRAEQANEVRLQFDPRLDFHTYGCEITPDTITWYIDGKEIGHKPNLHWHREMNVAISLGLRPPYATYTTKGFVPSIVEGTDEFPTEMEIDYVRVWDRVK